MTISDEGHTSLSMKTILPENISGVLTSDKVTPAWLALFQSLS